MHVFQTYGKIDLFKEISKKKKMKKFKLRWQIYQRKDRSLRLY